MAKTGFIYHPDYLKHNTGPSHPESPKRLEAIWRKISSAEYFDGLTIIEPKPVDIKWVYRVYSPDYIEYLKGSCEKGGLVYLDPDTPVCAESFQIALLAAGAVIIGIDRIISGDIENCFCAVRPPGHHSEKDKAMGFCLINNIAVGASYLLEKYKLSRVAIIDWDVHHGNGTQHIFYDNPNVFYISIHQYPFYPGTGAAKEVGYGEGEGATLNLPMSAGCNDDDYLAVFRRKIIPALEKFQPEFILVSAGFDAHRDDPLGGMNITAGGFYEMTSMLKEIAEHFCGGKILSILEGGYNLSALADSVDAHIKCLIE